MPLTNLTWNRAVHERMLAALHGKRLIVRKGEMGWDVVPFVEPGEPKKNNAMRWRPNRTRD